jgi:hypothetical protein
MAEKKLTMYAAKALGLADIFKAVFAEGLQGPVRYRVELAEPDGPSTGGGKLAMQHVKLIPDGGGSTIVIGTAALVDRTVELRTFGYLAAQHAQRFGKGAHLPVDTERYKALVKQMQLFFTDQGMTVVMLETPKVAEPEVEITESSSVPPVVWVLLGVIAIGLLAVGGFFLAKTLSPLTPARPIAWRPRALRDRPPRRGRPIPLPPCRHRRSAHGADRATRRAAGTARGNFLALEA